MTPSVKIVLSAAVATHTILSLGATVASQDKPQFHPRPYTVHFDRSIIRRARSHAAEFRPTWDIDQPAWVDGPPSSEIIDIAKHWAHEYDWYAEQRRINEEFDHYITTVPARGGNYSHDVDVHFIYQESEREDAIPLLMLHGWPSTSMEWAKVIPSLVDPGDDSKPAFHVIAPDLPGFGFSPAPTKPGLGAPELSIVFASLMDQLGYDRFALYSTDLGWFTALSLVRAFSPKIINHVSDFYLVPPNATDIERFRTNRTTPEESALIASANAWFAGHEAYAKVHSELPLSIAYTLNDSPVGFLAWMYQLIFTVADKPYTQDELITQAILLWAPGVYGNIRAYKELYGAINDIASGGFEYSSVPTSVLQFGGGGPAYPQIKDFVNVPVEWIERTANVTYYKRHPVGGHFPAFSEPQLVLEDIWAIFA